MPSDCSPKSLSAPFCAERHQAPLNQCCKHPHTVRCKKFLIYFRFYFLTNVKYLFGCLLALSPATLAKFMLLMMRKEMRSDVMTRRKFRSFLHRMLDRGPCSGLLSGLWRSCYSFSFSSVSFFRGVDEQQNSAPELLQRKWEERLC